MSQLDSSEVYLCQIHTIEIHFMFETIQEVVVDFKQGSFYV